MKQLPPPVIPNWHPRRELSRPSAEQISRAENRKRTLTYAGQNAVIPLVYGEQLVSGPIIAGPAAAISGVHFMIALCYSGPQGVERIEDVRLGSEIATFGDISNVNSGSFVTVGGIQVRVFDGRQTAHRSDMTSVIPGFDDAFRGIAYAYVVSPPEMLAGAMNLAFRVKGRKVRDPRGLAPQFAPVLYGGGPAAVAAGAYVSTGSIPDMGDNAVIASRSGEIYTVRPSGATAVYSGHSGDWARAAACSPTIQLVGGTGGRLIRVSSFTSSAELESGFGSSAINAVAVSSAGSTLFAAGEDGKISRATSASGPLTSLPSPVAASLNAIAMSSVHAIIVGSGGVILSVYGTEVSQFDADFDTDFRAVALADFAGTGSAEGASGAANRIIAVGSGGIVAVANGGGQSRYLQWYSIDIGFGGEDLVGVAYADGVVAVLGASGRVRASSEGLPFWVDIDTPAGDKVIQIAPGGKSFIFVTESGVVLRSAAEDMRVLAFTENPVLHMHDFVTNGEFGMAAGLIGAQRAADVADSLYSGIPRTRAGISIQDPMTEEDALALFATYAEVMWSYDGRDVAIIPDAPADATHEVLADTIREGSIQLSTAGLEEIPTQVRVMFSDRDDDTWSSRPAVSEIPEHRMRGLPASPSSVPLPGVFNRLEAERRAYQRLMRLQTPGRLRWQMFAPGMPYQAGDVVRLPDVRGMRSVDVRLTAQPEMIAPLLYQMGGEIYLPSHYPEGKGGIAAPEGAILILRGSAPAPEGWAVLNMGGRLIREGAPGNAGSLTSVSVSIGLQPAGAHLGERSPGTGGRATPFGESNYINYFSPFGQQGEPDHTHGISALSVPVTHGMARQQLRWIRKTGAPGLLPANVAFLSDRQISSAEVAPSQGLSEGYLVGGTTESRWSRSGASGTTSSAGLHEHSDGYDRYMPVDPDQPARVVTQYIGAGGHTHTVNADVATRLRSVALAVFESMGEAAIPSGGIVGWDGGTVPEGWALCDGSGGTVDLTDRFIYITTPAEAGKEHESESKMTVTVGGSTSWGGAHSHAQTRTIRSREHGRSDMTYHGAEAGGHTHAVTGAGVREFDVSSVQRYQLRFIQYIGG